MTQYHFKGFTEKGKRKNFLKFLEALKENKIPFEIRDKDDEAYAVEGCSLYGNSIGLSYIFFRDNNIVPLNLIKRYATKMTYNSWTIITIFFSLFLITIFWGLYNSYLWNNANVISGNIQDIKEDCYIATGLFSAPNKVCETTEIQINNIWYKNIGDKVFSIGQNVQIKCLNYNCK